MDNDSLDKKPKTLLNFRDIGGIQAYGNKIVKRGLIFRSANPDRISRKDVEKLRVLNIRTIIDLRAPLEVSEKPVSMDHAEKLNLPLDFQSVTRERMKPFIYMNNAEAELAAISNDIYIEILDASVTIIRKVMEVIASPSGTPLLIHCQAGKDRTGIVTAVILLSLGVDRGLIISDFLKSNEALLPYFKKRFLIRKIISMGFFPYKNMIFAVTVKKRNIESILDRIENHYGGIGSFLALAGINDPVMDKVRAKLLSE